VLRALGLGDLLTAVPALRGLRRALGPGWDVELVTARELEPLVRLAGAVDPLVDVVVDAEPFTLGPIGGVARNPDLAVNLHGRGPQSTSRLRELTPHRLVAFGSTARWRPDEHEVARWCRLLREAGLDDPDQRELRLPEPAERPVAADAVVVHPGAASSARRWPADRFAAVALALHARGERVVVTGTADERPLAERVAADAGLPAAAVLAGRTSLPALCALVAHARLVVCGDTGVAHLATAFGAPSVVLFGPTSPALWGPPPDGPHTVLWTGRSGDPHADEPDPGLLAIPVADVLAAVDGTLDARRGPDANEPPRKRRPGRGAGRGATSVP
jgi:hypothetical protein